MNYILAIKRPFTNFKNFIIGLLLLSIPFINIITNLIVKGYFLTCAKHPIKKLPQWKNLTDLLIKGALSILITIIYLLPSAISLSLIFFFEKITLQNYYLILNTNLTSFLTTSIIFLIIALYIIPLSILSYISKWHFKHAFNLKKIFKNALTTDYLIVWLFSLLYSFFITITLSITLLIPFGHFFFLSLSEFIIGVTTYTLYGQVYKEINNKQRK